MSNKPCNICRVVKPLEEFPPHSESRDGRRGYCRVCKAAQAASPKYRAARNAKRRARYAADDGFRAERSERFKEYVGRNRQRIAATRAAYWARYKAAHGDQIAARRAIRDAVKRGKMPPASSLPCCRCQCQAAAYHHHLGYSREHRLHVVPLCDACHGQEHRKASPAQLA